MSMYLVSVRLMTFNHARYIKAAMDGIMMQRVSFPMEVVVGDDFSTDDTLNIIRTYRSTTNIHIKILERTQGDEYWHNRQKYGRLYNFFDILQNCTGKYIALLDGDDYWIDPLKIQKQVEFLERNEDCSIVFHACNRKDGKGEKIIRHHGEAIMDLNEYLMQNPFASTASLMLSSAIVNDYKPWMMNLFAGDFVIRYLALLKGNIGYIDTVMSVYNKGTIGSWSRRTLDRTKALKEYKDNLKMLEYITRNYSKDIQAGLREKKRFLKASTCYKLALPRSFFSGLWLLLKRNRIVGLKRIAVFIKRKIFSA